MRKSTKMLLAAGRGGNRNEMEQGRGNRGEKEQGRGEMEQNRRGGGGNRFEYGGGSQMEYGGYGEENRRGGGGRRSEYGEYGEESRRRGGSRSEYGGYGEESRRRGGGSRSEYRQGGGGNRSEYGGYEGEESRRRGGERSEYGAYEGEESRRRRDRRGRFTRSGGYDEEDEDEDPRAVYQDEESYWPPMRREHESPVRGGYAPRREYMPEAAQDGTPNIIGFAVQPHTREDGSGVNKPFTRQTADEWTKAMQNEDGTRGPHWSFEQAKQLMTGKGINLDPVEFWVTLNMMYSDYCKVAKRHNTNTVDFYAAMAEAFLGDKDAGPGKLSKYYNHVVK